MILIYGCQKDDDNNVNQNQIVTEFSENFGNATAADFMGKIVNENNEPLEGVTVTVGGLTGITDINGIFSIQDANVNERFAYIKASKSGYINGSRSLVPTTGVNQVKIMLLEENIVATINSGESGVADLPNGVKVTFGGDYIKTDGSAYSGAVSVVLKHLDPLDENVGDMMPGMLWAEDANGNPRVLETFGMLAVELKGASGEKLQLAENTTAQIEVPVPTQLTSAPQTIPLWHFDEDNGYWKEEGFATLANGKYIGEVSHFSFWNYDAQFPAVYLCITVLNQDGSPVANNLTMLTHNNPDYLYPTSYGFTSEDGVVCGLVPQDEELVLKIFLSGCINAHEVTIGPFSTDSNIEVTIPDNNENTTTLVGQFNDCNGNPITNGYLQFNHSGNVVHIPVTNGEVNYTYLYCGNTTEFSVQGVDMTGGQTTTIISGDLTSPQTSFGIISSCSTFEDTDGDGVADEFEDINQDNNYDNDDTDQDGIPNYLDTNDDNDALDTADEDLNSDGDFTNDDTDGDGIPNYLDSEDLAAYFGTLTQCDQDGNGTEAFDLDSLNATVIGNQVDVTVTYHLTFADAQNDVAELSSPYVTGTTIIYTRVEHNVLPYYVIGEVALELSCGNNFGQPIDLYACDDTVGGGIFCDFDLTANDVHILNGASPNNYVITYHMSQADAENNTNPLANATNYCNTAPNVEQLFARVEDVVTGEFEVYSFSIFVNPLAVLNETSTTCDSGNTTYTVVYDFANVETVNAPGTITIDNNTNTVTISGLPVGQSVTVEAIASGGCSSVYTTTPPTCN